MQSDEEIRNAYYTASNEKDLLKLVNNLMKHGALMKIPGRRYKTFQYCLASPLQLVNMRDLCGWINKHKDGGNCGYKCKMS